MAKGTFEVGTHTPSIPSAFRTVRTKDGNRYKIPTAFDYDGEISARKLTSVHFKVDYAFDRKKRSYVFKDGHEYGANGMYFDRLYVLLCRAFNDGVFFIDTYLNTRFPEKFGKELVKETNAIQHDIDAAYEALIAANPEIPTKKDGSLNRRSREFKQYVKFGVWADEHRQERLDLLCNKVRVHIAQCLASGRIDLQIHPGNATIAKRELAGLDSRTAFFASGQLIEHLSIHLEAVVGE